MTKEELKKELKQELREEILKELNGKVLVSAIDNVKDNIIQKKYHKVIINKFGCGSGGIMDAIRKVAVHSMGYRYVKQITLEEKDRYIETLEKLYKFVLGESELLKEEV